MKRISSSKALLIFSLVLGVLLFGSIGLVFVRKPVSMRTSLIVPPTRADSLIQLSPDTTAYDSMESPAELRQLYAK